MGAVLQLVKPDALVRPIPSVPSFRPTGKSLSELRQWFLHEFASPLAESTRANYERTLKLATEGQDAHGKFGAIRPLNEHPSPAEVTGWLSDMKIAGYEDSTINLRRTDLVHIYEAGSRCGVSHGNPAIVIPWRKVTPKRAPLKDVKGTWAFLRAGDLSLRERAFVAVVRFCGLRKSEALGLEARHIDFKAGVLRVDQQRRKANKHTVTRQLKSEAGRRNVPMRAELRDVLAELLETEGDTHVVRCGKGGGQRKKTKLLFPFGEYQLGKMMKVLRGIDPEGFPEADAWHVFRHTVAVELWHAEWSEAQIQEWLGHASLEKTAVYLRSLAGRRIPLDDVDALDPDYRPRPKKKKIQKNESAAAGQADATPSSVTGVCAPAVVAVPPVAPMKRKRMSTTTAVEATPTATTTTPAVAELPARSLAEVRKLGAQAHEVGAIRRRNTESGHTASLRSSTGSPAEESEANGGGRKRSKAKKPEALTAADEEFSAAAALRTQLIETKRRAIVLFTDEQTEQAKALAAVAPELAEDLMSIIGGLRDVAEGREVNEPTTRGVVREKQALTRALENMTQAHRTVTEDRDTLIVRCERAAMRVEELETERNNLRAVLSPLPGETLTERAKDLTSRLRAYREKEAAGVKAIDDLCSAQPPASEGFDPGMYEGTGKGFGPACSKSCAAPMCNCGAMLTCDCGAVKS